MAIILSKLTKQRGTGSNSDQEPYQNNKKKIKAKQKLVERFDLVI